MKRFVLFSVLLLAVTVLAGCSSGTDAAEVPPVGATPLVATQQTDEVKAPAPAVDVEAPQADAEFTAPQPAGAALDETLVDEQGAVAVSVKPLNLGQEAGTLDFEVVMDTHSVDLSMDLASLATLTTDMGAEVAASSWDAPLGGHHATGVLSFPAASDGGHLLEGATALTLTLVDVDAPARTFTWSLQ